MNNPKLRFKADDGSDFPDWEERTVSDVFFKVKEKNANGKNTNVITNSAELGLVKQRDFFDKDIAVDGKTENYTVIKKGDFVYNPRKSKQAPYGPFNCYRLPEDGIVSPLYTCLTPKYPEYTDYLLLYFQSSAWYRYIYNNGAQGGARHDRVGMTDDLMQGIPITLPCLEEQQKIADFLSSIDVVIAKSEAEVAAWEKRKKGVMQKIFSQEVRFKKDDGSDYPDWEEDLFGNLFHISAGGDIDKDNSSKEKSDKYPYKVFANALTNEGLYGYANYYSVDGDTLTITGRGDVGHAISRHEKYVPIVRLLVCQPKHDENVDFFAESFNLTRIFIECTGVPQLTAPQASSVKVIYPSLPEQQKIADCLSALDDVINQCKAELEKWKLLKKGLLQQMFV